MLEAIKTSSLRLILENNTFDFQKIDIFNEWAKSKGISDNTKRRYFLSMGKGIIASSYPIDILFAVIATIGAGIVISAGLIISLGLIAIIVGSIATWKSSKKISKEDDAFNEKLLEIHFKAIVLNELLKRQDKKLIKECQLLIEKLLAYPKHKTKNNAIKETLLYWGMDFQTPENNKAFLLSLAKDKYHQKELIDLAIKNVTPKIEKPKMDIINKSPVEFSKKLTNASSKSKIVKAGLAWFSLITVGLASFYWCGSYAAASLGLAAVSTAMISPPGIIIAALLTIGIGCFYAYHVYKRSTSLQEKKNSLSNEKMILENKKIQYHSNDDLIVSLKNARERIDKELLTSKVDKLQKATLPGFHFVASRLHNSCSLDAASLHPDLRDQVLLSSNNLLSSCDL